MPEEEFVQLDQQQETTGQQGAQQSQNAAARPKDKMKVQTKDDNGDIIEQLSEEVAKQAEEHPSADDFVRRDHGAAAGSD